MLKLKLDEKGNAVVVNGMPVYVHDDGKEVPFDANAAVTKISELNAESAKHRHEAKETTAKLSMFEGIDPEAAKKALTTVKNLDSKKLIDAGEVEKVKESIAKAFEGQMGETKTSYEKKIKELDSAMQSKDAMIFNLMVTNKFSSSPFVQEKLTLPPDLLEARFGKAFKIEEGKVVAFDGSGKKIYSRKRPGEPADFDEALELLVDEYPEKARILKGSQASGSGKQPDSGNTQTSAFTLTREQAKNPQMYEKAKEAAAKAGASLQISD